MVRGTQHYQWLGEATLGCWSGGGWGEAGAVFGLGGSHPISFVINALHRIPLLGIIEFNSLHLQSNQHDAMQL